MYRVILILKTLFPEVLHFVMEADIKNISTSYFNYAV